MMGDMMGIGIGIEMIHVDEMKSSYIVDMT